MGAFQEYFVFFLNTDLYLEFYLYMFIMNRIIKNSLNFTMSNPSIILKASHFGLHTIRNDQLCV